MSEKHVPAGNSTIGRAPAVITPEQFIESESDDMFELMMMLVSVRWRHETNQELNPLKAATVLNEGWPQFRIDFAKDLKALREIKPALIGRIDFDRAAKRCWEMLKSMLRAWLHKEFEFPSREAFLSVTPRQIINLFERYYTEPEKEKPLSESEFEIEHTGYLAGMVDGFESSGMKRVGTIREIIEDVADEGQKRRTHQLVDELEDEEKRNAG